MAAMTNKVGQCILLGAGSGDPGLLTRAGAAWLARAEVVVYDRLISPALLALAPAAEHVYVGKRADEHAMSQEQINQLLVDRVRRGQLVVRLKGGDPFVFGRGGEEAGALRAAGLAFRVVPGVTAALAGGAYAGIPLTDRRCASSVALVTGHEDAEKNESRIDWTALAAIDTVVFYMGVGQLPTIAERLMAAGRSADTPAAVIENAASPRQRVVVATLGTIAVEVRRAGVEPPAVTVVGEVVRLREQLAWLERLPLFGQTVLVTRSRPQASELSAALAERGAKVIECPTIEIKPRDASAALRAWLDESGASVFSVTRASCPRWAGHDETSCLSDDVCAGGTPSGRADKMSATRAGETPASRECAGRIRRVLVLTSPNGAGLLVENLERLGLDGRGLAGVEIAAMGPGTASALRSAAGLRADVMPATFTTHALAERLIEWLGTDARHARVLLARADIGSPELARRLADTGATVTDLPFYRTRPPADFPPAALEALQAGRVDWITFTSSSTVTNFVALARQAAAAGRPVDLSTTRIAAIGPVTAATLRSHGLPVNVQADDHTIAGLVEAMCDDGGEVVLVDRIPFDKSIPLGPLRGPAKAYFKEKYKEGHNKFVNEDTGKTIELSGNGIAHAISEARDELTVYTLDAIPEIIAIMKRKEFRFPRPRKDGKKWPKSFLGAERYEARVMVDGNTYTAHVIVKTFEMGGHNIGKIQRIYYNHYAKSKG